MKVSASDIGKGDFLSQSGEIYQVVKIEHNFRGRGSANYKFKLKNIKSGGTIDQTANPDSPFEQIPVETVLVQYLYKDNENLTFMNDQTYEQYELPIESVGHYVDYLKETQAVYLLIHEGKALAMRPPQTVHLRITEAEDAVKGNTAMGARKTVVVETGAKVVVPLFIKKGEVITINPENGDYIERASSEKN